MDLTKIVQQLYNELCGSDQQQSSYNIQAQQILEKQTVQDNQQFKTKTKSFRWTEELHRRFCIVCTALHWKQCTPKYIHKFLPSVEIEVIGSHLQKTRIGIVNDGPVPSIESIPVQYQSEKVFIDIINHWTKFKSRMSDRDIKNILDQ
ncbi:Conserved_hypothetical protein [Hexamita inflata]|uniref:Uncharacterized protein n=1 Tax=Hexamita inflata TaxID=28002 RepID=A0AA86NRR3_9EUKA|nr:Conserved hypothetical protein [Hexamita inflata]